MNLIIRYVAILIFVVINLSACTPNKSTEDYIVAATKLSKQNKNNHAIIELKNAIKEFPNNGELRYLLGSLYLKQGDSVVAQKELERALKFGYIKEELVLKLANVYFLNSDEDSLLELEADSSEMGESTLLIIYTYQGLLHLYSGNNAAAENFISMANDISAEAIFSKLGAAWLEASRDIDNALIIVNDILQEDSDFSEAILLKAHLLRSDNRFLEASEQYSAYITLRPVAHNVKLFLANSLIAANDFQSAEPIVNKMLNRYPNHSLVNQQKAQVEYSKNNFEQAEYYADKAWQVKGGDKNQIAILISGISAFKQKKHEKAYTTLRIIEKNLPSSNPAKQLFSMLQLEFGYNVDETSQLILSKEVIENIDEASLELASISFAKKGDMKTAEEILIKGIELYPENISIKTRLGALKLFSGDNAGLQYFEDALAIEPALKEANFALALNLLKNKKYNEAIKLAKKWQVNADIEGHSLLLEGLALIGLNKFDEAKIVLLKAVKVNNATSAKYYLAMLSEKKSEYSQALKYFKEILSINAEHSLAISGITRVGPYLSSIEESINYLQELQKESIDNINLVKGVVLLFSRQGKINEAVNYLQSLENKYKNSGEYLVLLGDIYILAKETESAVKIYKKLTQASPENINGWLRLAGAYDLRGEYAKATETVSLALIKHSTSLHLKILKLQYLLQEHRISEVELGIKALGNIESLLLIKLKGDLAMAKGQFPSAVQYYSDVYDSNPIDNHVANLAKAYLYSGDEDKAFFVLENHIKAHPNDVSVYIKIADLYGRKNMHIEAKHHLEVASEKTPLDFAIWNNLSWIEIELGDFSLALTHAKRAFSIKPSNQVIDTLAYAYFKNGDLLRALALLEKITSDGEGTVEMNLHLAEVLIQSNKYTKAKVVLELMTKVSGKQRKMKELLLNEIISKSK
jgi:putative PEP-CTERM system TPR-repeat lipoprotein